jgi:membrane fusion protein (multidrug efflux system)
MAEQNESKEQKPEKSEKPEKPESRPRWPLVLAVVVVLVFIAVVLFLIFRPKSSVWTDDAHVMVHYATISPRVSGQVASVLADDNQIVHQGQLLVTLDDRDYQASVAQAEGALERDRASVGNASASVARQPAEIERAQAGVRSAEARLAFTQADAQRYSNLATTGAGTVQQRQSATTNLAQDQASLRSAKASLEAEQRQLEGLKSQRSAIEGTVRIDEAQLQQAQLNLSYTRIVAPIDGMIGVRSTQVGNYVTPGAGLMAVVPLHDVYVEANYREVDLRHVERGQHVRIHVDAYDIDLDGVVDSVPPATGTTFSPIQPDNATGNFTKIVQRLPVKIVLAPDQRLAQLLRVGMSLETTIDTGLADVAAAQRQSNAPVTAH